METFSHDFIFWQRTLSYYPDLGNTMSWRVHKMVTSRMKCLFSRHLTKRGATCVYLKNKLSGNDKKYIYRAIVMFSQQIVRLCECLFFHNFIFNSSTVVSL